MSRIAHIYKRTIGLETSESRLGDSNSGPTVYKTVALPTELRRQIFLQILQIEDSRYFSKITDFENIGAKPLAYQLSYSGLSFLYIYFFEYPHVNLEVDFYSGGLLGTFSSAYFLFMKSNILKERRG